MRKIDQQMNTAIRYRRNWAGSNTMVRVSREVVEIFLHGNHIASVDTATNNLTLFDGGWQSNTTKSRLNALLSEFNLYQVWESFKKTGLGSYQIG